MKKFLATLLAAVLMISAMSVNAFAATVTTEGNATADITAKYTAGIDTDAYKATIEWGSMAFTYTSDSRTWNPDTLKWENSGTSGWTTDGSDKAGQIIVTNYSSQAITAKISFQSVNGGVTGITVNGEAVVASGYSINSADTGTETGTAQIATYDILPVGGFTMGGEAQKVGSITITLE